MNSSYRNPLTYNDDVIVQTRRALERLYTAFAPAEPAAAPAAPETLQILKEQTLATRNGFMDAMDDDFNTAGALGHLFELVRAINLARDSGADAAVLGEAQATLRELTGVFGLRLDGSKANQAGKDVAPFLDLFIELRAELRRQKLWALSDLVRDRLKDLGVQLEDRKDGTTTRKMD